MIEITDPAVMAELEAKQRELDEIKWEWNGKTTINRKSQ